ncbi:MAG TPA: hypothetical protein VGQ83_34525 [Polyangia bacterium]|jgi:hypothetical protein
MVRRTIAVTVVTLALTMAASAFAQVPRLISFQGRLTDAAGNLKSGTASIQFGVYTAATGGAACFTETQTVSIETGSTCTTSANCQAGFFCSSGTCTTGRFTVNIGAATTGGIAATCTFTAASYLELKVGADPAMTPRLALTSAPYALRAQNANDAVRFNGQLPAETAQKPAYSFHQECAGAPEMGNVGAISPNFAPVSGVLASAASCWAYYYSVQTAGGCSSNAPACPAGCSDQGQTCEYTGYSTPSPTCNTNCSSCWVTNTWTAYYRNKRSCSCQAELYGWAR